MSPLQIGTALYRGRGEAMAGSSPVRRQGWTVGARAVPHALHHLALPAMKAAFAILVIFSLGNFSESIIPAEAASLPQYATLAMWLFIVFASLFVSPVLRLSPSTDTLFAFALAFYGFAALSVVWSNHEPASVMKGLALLVTTLGAYRLAVSMRLDDIIACSIVGLFAVSAASVLLVLFVPSIGVLSTWMHNGQWAGVFVSKQSLGVVGALLMFFASYRMLVRGGWFYFLITFSVAAACVVGSGSRGGGALALTAIAMLYLSSRSVTFARLSAFGPFTMIAAGNALIVYLFYTGHSFIPWFGEKIDLTERTIIWQYALSHLEDVVLLGYGLNGFWSIDQAYYHFLREHGWVLDNFHSGYIAIIMETGAIGMALFALCYLRFGMKMSRLVTNGTILRVHCNMLIGFANLSFFINFTETIFLRSTNFMSTLLVVFLFVACMRDGGPRGTKTIRQSNEWTSER